MAKYFKSNTNSYLTELIFFLIVFLGIFGLVKSSLAANWYVDNEATGSNNGTSWTNAWKNFDSIAGVNGGDTIYISGGSSGKTYIPPINYLPPSGTSSNPIIFKVGQDAGHNGQVTIDGGGLSNSFIYMGSANKLNYFILDGEYQGQSHLTLQNFISNTLTIYGGNGITLRYINFQGDVTLSLSSYFTFEHNYVECYCECLSMGGGTPPDLSLGSNKIGYNTFHQPNNDSGGDGAHSWGLGWPGTGTDIYNNVFIAYQKSGYNPNCHHSDAMFTASSKLRVYNNILRGFNSNYGLYWELQGASVHDLYIYNNVCEPGNYICIVIGGGTTTNTVVANNTCFSSGCLDTANNNNWDSSSKFYNNLSYIGSLEISPDVEGYNSNTNKNIDDNNCSTHFVSCSSPYDFHLLSSDTLFRDKGYSLASYFTTDILGNSRSDIWDIGAYEYAGSDTTPPTTPSGLTIN